VCKDKLKSTCKRYGHRKRLISCSTTTSSLSFRQSDYRFVAGVLYYSLTSKYSATYPDPDTILSALNGNGAHRSELKGLLQDFYFSTSHTSPTSCSGYNIMLVDDEKYVLYNLKVALADNGYHVQAFSDSQEALECFVQGSPHLVELKS
jgi:hypothetical protein